MLRNVNKPSHYLQKNYFHRRLLPYFIFTECSICLNPAVITWNFKKIF